nr:hypothetical protein GCM10020063_033650 [Dactylosporangium thailandense]
MTVMAWLDGEREAWRARAAALDHGLEEPDWDRAATGANTLGSLTAPQATWLIAKGPDASARALIGKESYLRLRQRIDVGRVAVARFELDALAFAAGLAGTSADELGMLMLPFRGRSRPPWSRAGCGTSGRRGCGPGCGWSGTPRPRRGR